MKFSVERGLAESILHVRISKTAGLVAFFYPMSEIESNVLFKDCQATLTNYKVFLHDLFIFLIWPNFPTHWDLRDNHGTPVYHAMLDVSYCCRILKISLKNR